MTMTMMLDVDGVVNVFDRDYRKGEYPDYYADTHRYVPDMKKKVYPFQHQGYTLHWSKECIHDISEIIGADKDNKLVWLTSWSPFADTILNPTFGFDNMKNVESADWIRSLHSHYIDKELFMRGYLESYPHIPIVWIDDEVVNESSYVRLKEEFGDTVSMLMLQTNEEIGISRKQISMMRDFNDYPEPGIHFMSEANDHRANGEHRGY